MSETEQRENILIILLGIHDTKITLENRIDDVNSAINKVEELSEIIEELECEDIFDTSKLALDEFSDRLRNRFLERQLIGVYNAIYDFKIEIESAISQLSKPRSKKLEERYYNLDAVLEKFNQPVQRYESIESAIKNIDEANVMLRDILSQINLNY